MRDDWVTVLPGEESLSALAAALLALARHPGDVRTAGGANEFIVPPYLAALYNPSPSVPPEEVPQAPRRRRSPKKEGGE